MVLAPYENPFWSGHARSVLGTSHWTESPGQTQILLRERLHLRVRCLDDPTGGAVICGRVWKSLDRRFQLVATATTIKKSTKNEHNNKKNLTAA